MHRGLNTFEFDLLTALARYRYLDTKHLMVLTGQANKNLYKRLSRLKVAGLIAYLENSNFKRDRLKDPQIYEITRDGLAHLSACGIAVKRTTWLRAGSYKNPVHNLTLCLVLASIEVACRANRLVFFAWDDILERAPKTTRDLDKPYVMPGIVPDALFAVEFPADFAFFALELDLTNHGKAEYQDKYARYADVIFKGTYKRHFEMEQRMYVLTICTNTKHLTDTLLPVMPERKPSPFLFKVHPPYGSFASAPSPAPQLFTEEWHRANQPPTNLGDLIGYTKVA
jgi:hypothetical protein